MRIRRGRPSWIGMTPRFVIALACLLPWTASAEPSTRRVGVFASVSPIAVFDYPADGHGPSAKGIHELGFGGLVAYRPGRYVELGLALRYDHGRENDKSMGLVTAHATVAAILPLGADRELRLGASAGPGLGWLPGYGTEGGPLFVLGPGVELSLAYAQHFHEGFGVRVEAGVRGDVLGELNAPEGSYLGGGELIHVQLPFLRTGITWP